MASFLTDGALAKIVGNAFDFMAQDLLLIQHTDAGDSYDPVLGIEDTPTDTTNPVRGIIADYRLHDIAGSGGLIQLGDKRLILFTNSFIIDPAGNVPVPQPDDLITTTDGNETYKVSTARQDPAQATYDLTIRKV